MDISCFALKAIHLMPEHPQKSVDVSAPASECNKEVISLIEHQQQVLLLKITLTVQIQMNESIDCDSCQITPSLQIEFVKRHKEKCQ